MMVWKHQNSTMMSLLVKSLCIPVAAEKIETDKRWLSNWQAQSHICMQWLLTTHVFSSLPSYPLVLVLRRWLIWSRGQESRATSSPLPSCAALAGGRDQSCFISRFQDSSNFQIAWINRRSVLYRRLIPFKRSWMNKNSNASWGGETSWLSKALPNYM